MRRTIAMLATGAVVAALATTSGSALAGPSGGDDARAQAVRAGLQTAAKGTGAKAPAGANPFLALLPDPARADYAGWRKYLAAKGRDRAAQRDLRRAATPSPYLVDEQEPAGISGGNDVPATGQRVAAFGTASGKNPKARVLGRLSPEAVTADEVEANAEDDGAIPLAPDTGIGIGTERKGIKTSATIGDGPHGSAGDGKGDFDFYKVRVPAGNSLRVDIDTPAGELDSVVALFDEAGKVITLNDDGPDGLDSLLSYRPTTDATLYVMVTGFAAVPSDPNDPASGNGAQSEGPYDVTITSGKTDLDFYAVKLRKGDVLGASVAGGAASVTVYDTAPREVHGSMQDASSIYPANTPLPGGGNGVTEYVAKTAGWHYVGVGDGSGTYDITVEAYRPGLEGKKVTQTLFLDFDGARVNTAIFGGPGVRTLSPLSAFLGNWGLTGADEDAIIDTVVATVRENIRQDLINSGLNDKFAIKILNSRDNADAFGQPNVSRVIVGGTIDQSGVATIGISQSIDPGNFNTEESALVLLDVLSSAAGEEASLNTYIKASSDRVKFVGRALGNVVAHESGHFFGDWHVDQFNETPNLMDQGGNFPVMFGVGPDAIGGTADDIDVDFGEDVFNPNEGFTGTEDTLGRLVFGLTR